MQKNYETIKNNLVTDLRAFIHGAGFRSVTFGLSGGMDSALTLALCVSALGAENVHTAMMTTKNTTQLSIDLANEIAKNFGTNHRTIDIQPLVDMTMKTAGNPTDKIAIENIQARVRGMLCMTWSNEFGHMVMANGNKSEAAMGYCTLYGDTVGAVAPLGDLYKTEVYALAELFPEIPRGIITRPASAELSPGQKDSDSMPEYHVLDPILAHIIDGAPAPAGADKELLKLTEKRYNANAFKRAQMAPVLKVRGS